MAQWNKTDNAANSVSYAAKLLNVGSGKTAQAANNTALYANTTADAFVTGKTVGQFGIAIDEVTASPAAHAGWVLRTEGSGNRAGRVTMEVLVAGSMITGDGDADVAPKYVLKFSSQPAAATTNTTTAAVFSAPVVSKPAGATITYQWQANTGSGFANVVNGAVYGNVTTSSVTVIDPTGLTGAQLKVVVSAANSAPITSNPAVLTVV